MIDPIQCCPTCKVVKTPRSKHCNICDMCVERMDHHCPWLNNCVGITNHLYFMFMINFYMLNILCMLIFTVRYYITFITNDSRDTQTNLFPIITPVLPDYILTSSITFQLTHLLLILLFMPYVYFIGFIWYRQVNTLFSNKTTAEKFGKKKVNRLADEDAEDG